MSRKKRNTNIFKDEIEELYGNKLLVLGEFVSMKTKIKMFCTIHNEIFEKEPDKILNRNQHCSTCGRQRIANSRLIPQEEFEKKFYEFRDIKEFKLLSKYKGDREDIEVFHNVCAERYKTTPSSIWNSKGCPICNDKRKTTDKFKDEVYNLVNNEYSVLGIYLNCYTPIKMIHNKCHHSWELIPNSFLQGSRCPKCNESKGERFISDFMDRVNVPYLSQYKHSECKYKAILSFDFKINNIYIEYDGEQHFKPYYFDKNTDRLKKTQLRDRIKNQFCIGNNISLIRIPYWEKDNLEYILENVLAYFNMHKLNNKIDKEIVERYLVDSHWNHDTYLSWQHKENRYWLNRGDVIEEQIHI